MEMLELGLMVLLGMGLGLFYFWGLWLTVQRVPESRSYTLLVLASFALRSILVVGAMVILANGKWERMVACLVGFVLVRLMVVNRVRSSLRR